jgi:ribose transport system substrate-binding protein
MCKNIGGKLLKVLLIAFILCFTSIGQGENRTVTSKAALKPLTFIFIPKLIHPWYNEVLIGAEQCAATLKKAGLANITIKWYAPPKADLPTQIQFIENAISAKPDGIAISTMEETGCDQVINEAVNRNIPVVTFCTDGPKSKRSGFVGRVDTRLDGMMMADTLAKAIHYEGEVGLLVGSLGAPDHKHRAEGFIKEIQKYPKIQIVSQQADNDDIEKAANLTDSMLAAYPNLKGIYGCDATAPIGAANAVTAAGKVGKIVVVGQDDLPETVSYMKKGVIQTVIVQKVKKIGWLSCLNLWNLTQGRQISKIVDIDILTITKKDLGSYASFKKL